MVGSSGAISLAIWASWRPFLITPVLGVDIGQIVRGHDESRIERQRLLVGLARPRNVSLLEGDDADQHEGHNVLGTNLQRGVGLLQGPFVLPRGRIELTQREIGSTRLGSSSSAFR